MMVLSSKASLRIRAVLMGSVLLLLPVNTAINPFVATGSDGLPGKSPASSNSPASMSSGTLDRLPTPERMLTMSEPQSGRPRLFLSSFRLPDKLIFSGITIPMDNWQVRERIEYEFYQFLQDEGESIIMAKRTGRCFPPVER